jgi:hypothetical protein
MVNQYDATEMVELTAWAQQAAEQLGLEPLKQQDVDVVLSTAADFSTELVRPAGPVAMYLAGVLFARGQAPDVETACELVGGLLHDPELTGMPHDVKHTP